MGEPEAIPDDDVIESSSYRELLDCYTGYASDAALARDLPRNRAFWLSMRDRLQREYAGKVVVLANGGIVAVANTFADAEEALHKLFPAPECYHVFEADGEVAPSLEPEPVEP